MVKTLISDLDPGMKLARDVVLEDGRLLLLAGFTVKPLNIRKLEVFNVPYVYIDESVPVSMEDYTEEGIYREAFSTIKKVLSSVRGGKDVDIPAVKETVDKIIQTIINNETIMLQLTGIRDIDNYTFFHSVDVCIYSVVVGKKMGYSLEELASLGMGAILHDIGKCRIPNEILQKPASLTKDEFQTMRLHTVHGCEIIKSTRGLNRKIANIAFQHHEKWDGSGYPLGIRNTEIDPFARIVTISDIYDALTADRVYKKKILPHVASEYIIKNSKILFDPYLAEVFISSIAVYPEGTIVLLSTGEIGSIASPFMDSRTKPKISIITRKSGPPVLQPYILDLEQKPEVNIVDVFF